MNKKAGAAGSSPSSAAQVPGARRPRPGVDSGDITQRGAERRARGGASDSGGARRESECGRVGATMATVDLEKLRMSGAGKAIGVLTSGGDAQGGRGHAGAGRRRAGVLLSPGPWGAPAPSAAPGARGQQVLLPACASRRLLPLPAPVPFPVRVLDPPPRAGGPRTCRPPRPLRPARRGCVRAAGRGRTGCFRRPPLLPTPGPPRTPSRWRVSEAPFPGGQAERRPVKDGQVPAGPQSPGSNQVVMKHDSGAPCFPQTTASRAALGHFL